MTKTKKIAKVQDNKPTTVVSSVAKPEKKPQFETRVKQAQLSYEAKLSITSVELHTEISHLQFDLCLSISCEAYLLMSSF